MTLESENESYLLGQDVVLEGSLALAEQGVPVHFEHHDFIVRSALQVLKRNFTVAMISTKVGSSEPSGIGAWAQEQE